MYLRKLVHEIIARQKPVRDLAGHAPTPIVMLDEMYRSFGIRDEKMLRVVDLGRIARSPARGPPRGENPVRVAAPRDSKPQRPKHPSHLQPQARPPRETAPRSPSKPTPRGEFPGSYLSRPHPPSLRRVLDSEGALSTPYVGPRTTAAHEACWQKQILHPAWAGRARSRATDARTSTSRVLEARSCTSFAKEDEDPGRGGKQSSRDLDSMRAASWKPSKIRVAQKSTDEKEHDSKYCSMCDTC